MLQALAHSRVEPMLLDAVAFSQLPPEEMRYSHVLLKEVVHHLPQEVRCSSYVLFRVMPRRWFGAGVSGDGGGCSCRPGYVPASIASG